MVYFWKNSITLHLEEQTFGYSFKISKKDAGNVGKSCDFQQAKVISQKMGLSRVKLFKW